MAAEAGTGLRDRPTTPTNMVSLKKRPACRVALDINKISEGFIVESFREVFGLPGLRDLNTVRLNFEGFDLADDASGTGFQVTATTDLEKTKATLQTVLDAGLHAKYPEIRN